MHSWLRLIRIQLLPTALADVWAGYFLSCRLGVIDWGALALVSIASCGLYAGGMVLNDVADGERDRALHPSRPIPSGRLSVVAALFAGTALVLIAPLAMLGVGLVGVGAACQLAILVLLYNALTKNAALPGALTMGLLRAGNLLLGATPNWDTLGLRPEVWASATTLGATILLITALSSLEEKPQRKGFGTLLLVLPLPVWVMMAGLFEFPVSAWVIGGLLHGSLLYWAVRIYRQPERANYTAAVKTGVTGVIALDASLLVGAGAFYAGLAVFALLLPCFGLSHVFRGS